MVSDPLMNKRLLRSLVLRISSDFKGYYSLRALPVSLPGSTRKRNDHMHLLRLFGSSDPPRKRAAVKVTGLKLFERPRAEAKLTGEIIAH